MLGTYYLYIKTEWEKHKEFDYFLSSYGPECVQFEKIDKIVCPNLVEQILKNKATTLGKLKPYKEIG